MSGDIEAIRARLAAATPGPWRWELNRKHHTVEICGGLPAGLFDKTVVAFRRYGMKGAAPEFWHWGEGGKWLGEPQRADELAVAYPGREHHAGWCANIDHPDARLIATAPTDIAFLLGEIDRLRDGLSLIERLHTPDQPAAYGGDELSWAQRHVGTLRRIARDTLDGKEPAI